MARFEIKPPSFGSGPRFVHEEPNLASKRLAVLTGLVEIIEEVGEWRKVDHFEDISKSRPNATGFVRAEFIGDPVTMPPEPKRRLKDFARACVMVSAELRQGGEETLSSSYLMALAVVEHGLKLPKTPTGDELLDFSGAVGRPAGKGAYGLTPAQWKTYLAAKGESLNQGMFDYYTSNAHPRAAAHFAVSQWRAFVAKRPNVEDRKMPPRRIDLFLSKLIGVEAAYEATNTQRVGGDLGQPLSDLLTDQDDLPEPSAEATRAAYPKLLGKKTEALSVADCIARCTAALDEALKQAHACLDHLFPELFPKPPAGGAAWMKEATDQFDAWKQNQWTEKDADAKTRIRTYFKATDFPNPPVRADGTVEHWCGAFAAFCMRTVGAPVPAGAAGARHWANWGEVSTPPEGVIPVGAVVTLWSDEEKKKIGHVTFFVRKVNDTHFEGLGGNQGDKVKLSNYRIGDIVEARSLGQSVGDPSDIAVLAKTLYGEIRESLGGDEQPIRNVAHVVLNRVAKKHRGKSTIAEVCLDPMQFSCWNTGTSARKLLDSLPETDGDLLKLRAIADEVVSARASNAPPPASLANVWHYYKQSFYEAGRRVMWMDASNPPVLRDGKHVFFANVA